MHKNSVILSINHCQFFYQALLSIIDVSVIAFGRLANRKGSWRHQGRSKSDITPCHHKKLAEALLHTMIYTHKQYRYRSTALSMVSHLTVRPATT